MRTLSEIIADLDTVLKACIKEYGVSGDIVIAFAALTAELKDYADAQLIESTGGRNNAGKSKTDCSRLF